MKYKGLVKGSRTLDFAAILGVFGAIQQTLPMVQDQLGSYYGWIFMGVAATIAGLRKITTKPL